MRRGSHAVPGLPDNADSFTDPAGLLHDLDGGLSGGKDCDSRDGGRGICLMVWLEERMHFVCRARVFCWGWGRGVLVMSVHKNVVVL